MRTYGLLIEPETRHNHDYVVAKVLTREDNSPFPVNPRSIESSVYGASRFHNGLSLDGLRMEGFGGASPGLPFLGFRNVEFFNILAANEKQLTGMLKAARLANLRIKRENGSTPEERMMAMARALKLDWCVVCQTPFRKRSGYDTCDWQWRPIDDGPALLSDAIASIIPVSTTVATETTIDRVSVAQ